MLFARPHRHTFRAPILGIVVLLTLAGQGFAATASGGRGHSAVVLPDGSVWTWGANDRGQIGDGTGLSALTPTQVPGLAGIVGVASGDDHVLALGSDGTVWAWGTNDVGQVGDGTTVDRVSPVVVLSGAVGIDGGPDFSLA